jgi:hypothetical protein
MITSSTPVTVTVCGVFQFAVVNVRVEGLTDVSVESFVATDNTTLLDGCALSTTVNVSVVPDSLTAVEPPVCEIVKPPVKTVDALVQLVPVHELPGVVGLDPPVPSIEA